MGNTDEEALGRFVACRDAGDGDGARQAAKELVELVHDRIDNRVSVQARRMQIDRSEHPDIVQEALVSVIRFVGAFEGTSMGELHNAIKQIVHRRCVDNIRRRKAHLHDADSLEGASWEPGEEGERHHEGEVDLAWEEHERTEERLDAAGFVAWALPQLSPRYRKVIERTMADVDPEAIALEMGVTMDNLYQLRSRGMSRLRALHREHFS